MTNDQINEAISKAVGFEIYFGCIVVIEPDKDGEPKIVDRRPITDYCNDLNAVRLAWSTLKDEPGNRQTIIACNKLVNMCGGIEQAICATSRQRAEAFLRTLGLWKEEA